jgi:hypothetical protein
MRTEATRLERPERAGLWRVRAEVTRVDELAELRARRADQVARQLDEAAAFEAPMVQAEEPEA